MESQELYKPTSEEIKKAEGSMSEKQKEDSSIREKSFEPQRAEAEKEQLNGDRKKQESMDNEKLEKVRSLLGLEQVNQNSTQVFSSKEGITDFDTALGELVLENHPDKIVEQILTHIPEGFSAQDNNLGEVEKSIRIWTTESAGNAARHISYRQNEEKNIQYDIKISCANLTEGEKKYLQISMTDNGVGIKPENLEKIGSEQFTTSKENKEVEGNLHAGGHGRFSVDYKNEIATPRGWEMAIQNRSDGQRGAATFLKIPLMQAENISIENFDWQEIWKKLELNSPKRKEVFPDGGDEKLSEDEIIVKLNAFLKEKNSEHDNYSGIDAEEFPEIIDEDIRNVCMKLNELSFLKTKEGCGGHEYQRSTGEVYKEGYSEPYLIFLIKEAEPKADIFLQRLNEKFEEFKKSNISGIENIKVESYNESLNVKGLRFYRYNIAISPTKKWCMKNNKKYIEYPKQLGFFSDWCIENGYEYSDKEDSESRIKWEEAKEKFHEEMRRFNEEYFDYFKSEEVKNIRDEFFNVFGQARISING